MKKGEPPLPQGPKPARTLPTQLAQYQHGPAARLRAQIAARLEYEAGGSKCPQEVLRDLEKWVGGGCNWKEVVLLGRIVVEYYKIPKGKPRPPSKEIKNFLKSKIGTLRKWRDASPEPMLGKVLGGFAEQLESWAEGSRLVSRLWYHSAVHELINCIAQSRVKDRFQGAHRLLKYLGAPISPDALKVEYHRRIR